MSTADLPRPLGRYARWRRAGDLVFTAGVSARLPDGRIDGVSEAGGVTCLDVVVQTRRVLQHLEAILREAGAGLDDCVDLTVFLVRAVDFDAFNQAYGERFADVAAPPTRTTVVVRALPHPHMAVEIKAVAVAPGQTATLRAESASPPAA